ncbi:MAG: ACP S-malonyltransferase [Candidatus Aminicenantes bacterium]|nr:ACP S-malonyltransferase [Candidatus Aminicenantes bacterium]
MNRMAFLFPGQGSQGVGMGKDFYDFSSQAQEIFLRADETLGFKISKLCFEGPEEELKLTQNTQPALLSVSFVAYVLLGMQAWIAAGHSLGEYSALVAAGSLRFEDALLLVHKRGMYMQEAVPAGEGAMAAVLGSGFEDVEKALKEIEKGVVQIANWNSQEQIVISGHKEAVEEALALINSPRSVMLPVSAPFHCELMKRAEEKLSYDLDQVEFKDLKFPIITNVDAEVIHKGDEARDALKRQVTRPVLWYKSMEILLEEKADPFVELGSGKVLTGLAKRISRKLASPPTLFNVEDPVILEKVRESLSRLL